MCIRDSHIAAAGGIAAAIEACRRYAAKFGRFRVMVEARDIDEFKEALAAGPDRILLDNMTLPEVRRCVELRAGPVELEATGGIGLENVSDYAETGVDYISIGALTHSVTALDLSLLVIRDRHINHKERI